MIDLSQLAQLPSAPTPTPAATSTAGSSNTVTLADVKNLPTATPGAVQTGTTATVTDIIEAAFRERQAAVAAAGGSAPSNAWAQADAEILKYLAAIPIGGVVPTNSFTSLSTVDTSHALLSSPQSTSNGYDIRGLPSRLG